jgi:hypothetical protein
VITLKPCTDYDINQVKRLFENEPETFNKQIVMGMVNRLEAAERYLENPDQQNYIAWKISAGK